MCDIKKKKKSKINVISKEKQEPKIHTVEGNF